MNKIKHKTSFDVKNTTSYGPLDLLCPYTCKGCGRTGTILCERCKKNLCCRKNLDLIRRKLTVGELDMVWGYSIREGLLDKLIKEYKYQPVRGVGVILAGLIDEILPAELGDVVVVPMPTIEKHIRARGFDHAKYLAKKLARMRGWKCSSLLMRINNSVQVGARRAVRERQASQAYASKRKVELDSEVTFLLVDDVWTTGASMRAAARVLGAMGAKKIMGAVVAVSERV